MAKDPRVDGVLACEQFAGDLAFLLDAIKNFVEEVGEENISAIIFDLEMDFARVFYRER